MQNKELVAKLAEIEQRLQALGDLNQLIQSISPKKEEMDAIIAEAVAKKPDIDQIPQKKEELEKMLQELSNLKSEIGSILTQSKEIAVEVTGTRTESAKIHELALQQLGTISNEKLSNSFDKVKDNLKTENENWFNWLLGTGIFLLLVITGIVIWQTYRGDTIFEISFIIKIALTSPIILFEVFVSQQYSRSRRLIEEYEFKASIARSLEAYKEIIEKLFADQPGDEYKKKLDFILGSIGQLYSSPMANIKNNEIKNVSIGKEISPVLSEMKNGISDIKSIVSKDQSIL